jgi:hypothetical protein
MKLKMAFKGRVLRHLIYQSEESVRENFFSLIFRNTTTGILDSRDI